MKKKINYVISRLLKKKCLAPDGLIGKIYQIAKELTPILYNLFQKIEKEIILPSSIYEAIITMTPKPDKGSVKKKLQTSMSYELRHKNPQQNRGTCLAQLVEHVILHLGVVNLSPGRVQRLLKKLNKIMKCTYDLKKKF